MQDFDEHRERMFLGMLIGILLDRAFPDSPEFEHWHMSPGEALGRCLNHFGAGKKDGRFIRLTMPKDWIRNKVRLAQLQELPALGDVLEVVLAYDGYWGTVPRDYQRGQRAQFSSDTASVLRQMGMLRTRGIPDDRLHLILVNHGFMEPVDGAWDSKTEILLRNLAEKTLVGAPEEFVDDLEGRTHRPCNWAASYLNYHWRYGDWLSDLQLERALYYPYAVLPDIIARTLACGGDKIHVPKRSRN